jgi:hypothetical protein
MPVTLDVGTSKYFRRIESASSEHLAFVNLFSMQLQFAMD